MTSRAHDGLAVIKPSQTSAGKRKFTYGTGITRQPHHLAEAGVRPRRRARPGPGPPAAGGSWLM
jgi:hypothetical protein